MVVPGRSDGHRCDVKIPSLRRMGSICVLLVDFFALASVHNTLAARRVTQATAKQQLHTAHAAVTELHRCGPAHQAERSFANLQPWYCSNAARSTWTVTLAAVAAARPAPLKLQLRRPEAGRAGASLRAIGVDGSVSSVRGGSYDESYDDDWSGEGYAGGDAYDYGGAPPVDAPAKPRCEGLRAGPEDRADHVRGWRMATMLGISLFFEKNLIRVGNILLVLGAPIVVGPARASRYVLAPAKLRATLVFAFGFSHSVGAAVTGHLRRGVGS